jgi:hypothetical protein
MFDVIRAAPGTSPASGTTTSVSALGSGVNEAIRDRAARWHIYGFRGARGVPMLKLEASPQQFGEFLLKAGLVQEKAVPYRVRWVRRLLTRPATDEPMADQAAGRDHERGRAAAPS